MNNKSVQAAGILEKVKDNLTDQEYKFLLEALPKPEEIREDEENEEEESDDDEKDDDGPVVSYACEGYCVVFDSCLQDDIAFYHPRLKYETRVISFSTKDYTRIKTEIDSGRLASDEKASYHYESCTPVQIKRFERGLFRLKAEVIPNIFYIAKITRQ